MRVSFLVNDGTSGGRRVLSGELVEANELSCWVRLVDSRRGERIIQRKLRRDFTQEEALKVEDWRREQTG